MHPFGIIWHGRESFNDRVIRCSSPPRAGAARQCPAVAARSMVTSVDDLGQGAPGPALLRQIPRTDQLLADPRMRAAERRIGRDLVKAAITRAQGRARAGEVTADA